MTNTPWAAAALAAGSDVHERFGHRLMGLPGTWLGSPAPGLRGTPFSEWHYWWQAHYLDAIIDAAELHGKSGDSAAAAQELARGRALLRGILIRNFGLFPNFYFDDMAWLALAAHRLHQRSHGKATLARFAVSTLTRQLHGAHDDVLGGGLFWSRKRDFKNTPVNGPAALHLARLGEHATAAAVTDWLRNELFDPETGLYLDGVHPTPAGRSVERTIYTYNQGTVLGALLALGEERHVVQARDLIAAIQAHLSVPGQGLRLEPGGDGGLFTGILCRYLALAARSERLPAQSRDTASSLITDTAVTVMDQQTNQLSNALQRWMILTAAATI